MKFLCCSDLHLRSDVPRCRKQTSDEWIETQRNQLTFIANKAKEYDCPVVICGDIFDSSIVSDYIKNMFMMAFRETVLFAIAGQHDEYFRSWTNLDKSSFGTLYYSNFIKEPLKRFAHYGQEIQGTGNMLFLHTLIFPDQKSIPPNAKAMTAQEALDLYPDVNFIFAGDQHKGFVTGISDTTRKRYVLVPGCMNTQHSDQDYLHYIWYVDTEKVNIQKIEIPDDCEIVTDSYVQEKEEKMDRVHSFVSLIKEKMKEGKGTGIDFKENARKAMQGNKELTPGAVKIINEWMGF